jgi:hypothetical protein
VTLVGQRVYGIALGYEDLIDHDQLRHDPVLAALGGKLEARRSSCAALAGKSTLNRLELSRSEPTRYHKIGHDGAAIERLFVDLFLEAHAAAPAEIILDLDATDDPVHGEQEGRFFHGYYGGYCYLPLYVFCGRHLLAAKLRPANIDGSAGALEEVERIVEQIRACWPGVRIVLRADSGFAREALMAWCEAHGVDYLFGLARNVRLEAGIADELAEAAAESAASDQVARRFKDFMWTTRDRWGRRRRVVGKAEHTPKGSNPRFIVTSLGAQDYDARAIYEDVYCARGEMENRIKEQQLDLFADRTSAATMRANQLRLWFASMAYVLMAALRRIGLVGSQLADATCGMRHHPSQAAEDRRPRPTQRATAQARNGVRLPLPAGIPQRLRLAWRSHPLTIQTGHRPQQSLRRRQSCGRRLAFKIRRRRTLPSRPIDLQRSPAHGRHLSPSVRNAG